ncbi:MAG: polyprenyl synthetase family protein [Prevotella sp.]|nr:polyprenyl synthetase family protein [Prevotella sp.]
MHTTEDLLKEINAILENHPYNRQPESLYDPVRYVLAQGGKRIRPTLMMLAYELYKDHPEDIILPAVGLETYHNYTLLHDDLMDNADMRRGNLTVHKRWNANTAILSGDSMLVLAYKCMQQVSDDKLRPVLEIFTETALQVGEGQQYDMDFEQRNDVAEEEYIEMIRLKTSVLLACALKIGAVLADAPKADAENLYKFGEQVGLAFQLQDDYLDVYGDPKVFGKAVGGDITSNKKTYMLINAFNRANAEQRAELTLWTKAREFDKQEKISAVTKLYNEMGINKLAQERIAYYFDQSSAYLDAVKVDEDRKSQLRAYAERMMKRKY